MTSGISILYEDEDCVVINKPAGLIVHSDGKKDEESVVDWVLKKYPDTKGIGEPLILSSGKIVPRPGIVHRIDRETSGALLITKNQEAFTFFKNQFKERDIGKEYHAFVHGNVSQEFGTIDRPIGRSRSDFRQWSAQRGARGELREAITRYEVGKRGEGVTFVIAKPLTGRTHQIRVHFKAINHPLVCDSLYAPKLPPLLGFKRLALHAYTLEFFDRKSQRHSVSAPYPEDFQNALRLMGVAL